MVISIQSLLEDICGDAVDAYQAYAKCSGIFRLQRHRGGMPESFLQSHFLMTHGSRYPLALEYEVPSKRVDMIILNHKASTVETGNVFAVVEYKREDNFAEVRAVESRVRDALAAAQLRPMWVATVNVALFQKVADQEWHREELERRSSNGYVVSSRFCVQSGDRTDLCVFAFAKQW